MIRNYVSISLKDEEKGELQLLQETKKSISLTYPCPNNKHDCTPYILDIEKGVYKFECWGSIAGKLSYEISKPGYGGYTSGIIYINDKTKFYVYIGNKGFFNAVKNLVEDVAGVMPGGATDVRLNTSDKWWSQESLASRIMVAAGGGSAEWNNSKGGNGGGLIGGESISAKEPSGNSFFEKPCKGATQTSGSECDPLSNDWIAVKGEFGSAGKTEGLLNNGGLDYIGFGGGGYYGGTSYTQCFASSGGSSFISGHKGCNAIENSTSIVHKGDSVHYSGFVFTHTNMIPGEQEMPLPTSHLKAIYDGIGAFRITLLLYQQTFYKKQKITLLHLFVLIIL